MTNAISTKRLDHVFFGGIAVLLMGYALLGFWRSYFAAGLALAPLPSLLVHVHASLFVGWLALLFTQTLLISGDRFAVHRRLGAVMGWGAALIVVIGPATVVMALRRPASELSASAFAGDLAQTISFAILIAMGIVRRRDGPAHKRFTTLASAAIIGPAIIRWPIRFIQDGPPIGVLFFYLLPALLTVGYDLSTRGRVHRATWLGLGLMVATLLTFILLPAWPAWMAFTRWVQQG